jgi:hypothetical protein
MSEQLPELVPELVPDLGSPALADGDAIADQAPFDGTPSDPTEDNRSPRIPHLGHALLFGAITALSLMLAVVVFCGLNSAPRGGSATSSRLPRRLASFPSSGGAPSSPAFAGGGAWPNTSITS